MGLKEKIKSSMRRMSNASSASHTSDSANTESTTATDITPSKKASRLHDVAGSAKVTNSGLEAEDDTAASVADSAKADNTELEAEDSVNPAESVAGATKVERPGLKTQDSVDTAVSVAPGDVSDPTLPTIVANHQPPQPSPTKSSGRNSTRRLRSKSPARYTRTKCIKRYSQSSMSRCGRPDISWTTRTVVLSRCPRSKSPMCTAPGKPRQRMRGKVASRRLPSRK